MCDATHKKGGVFTNSLKKTQVGVEKSTFALGTHAQPTATCHHRRYESVTPAGFQRRNWSLLYEKLLYTYIAPSY